MRKAQGKLKEKTYAKLMSFLVYKVAYYCCSEYSLIKIEIGKAHVKDIAAEATYHEYSTAD